MGTKDRVRAELCAVIEKLDDLNEWKLARITGASKVALREAVIDLINV